ncbi:MAG: 2-C-methyl-D-erythritol 4-phosphate cytidylyltransferase, partial [Actinomycetota bacterium]|nr:2-C-methyl-D-erythritol 4-phosphate cytidylyltransferase [Actinomycetota bacterium]
ASDATDDAGLVEAAGGRVVVVSGDPGNVKITAPADLERLRVDGLGEAHLEPDPQRPERLRLTGHREPDR